MTDDSDSTPPPPPDPDYQVGPRDSLPRRDFLRVAGAGAGLLLVGGVDVPSPKRVPGILRRPSAPSAIASSDIVVIGAGGWGSFTALNLVQRGAKVTLVDAYGPGN